MIALRHRAVRWSLAPRGAARGRTVREAIVVELRLPSGAVGHGEAAPLPGMSSDTLADVVVALASFRDALDAAAPAGAALRVLPAHDPREPALDVTGALATIAAWKPPVASPAARFAIETAWLDAIAREHGASLASVLRRIAAPAAPDASVASRSGVAAGDGAASASVAVVVDDVAGARAAHARGVRTLKLKVNALDASERARIEAIAAAAPGARLRLDANQAWPYEHVAAHLAALAHLPIDFVEEPCVAAHRLLAPGLADAAHATAPLAIPIALDESLATLDAAALDRALRSRSLGVLVLKPTLLGGFAACLALAARARAAGVPAIVTHALEGPIGTAACAELALALATAPHARDDAADPRTGAPDRDRALPADLAHLRRPRAGATAGDRRGGAAVGLAPHAALDAWDVAVPQLADDAVRAAAAAGLGLDADAIDRACARLGDPLSVGAAAREAPDAPAIFAGATAARADEPAATRVPRTAAGAPADRREMRADPAGPAPVATWETAHAAADRATRIARVGAARGPRVVVAHASVPVIAQIHGALDARQPLVLLHAKLPPAQQDAQRTAALRAELDDAAVVLFTSGSTGAARGVVLGRDALIAATEASAAHLGWRADDRWLCALPLAHAGGLAVVVRCLAARRPLVLVDEPAALVAALATCTLASLVPAQLAALLDDPAWRPPPQLRAVLLGGAAAPPAVLARAAERGVPFLTTYGMTEAFGQIATAAPARAGDPAAPLIALPGVTIEAGTRAAPSPIRVRAPSLATRYLDGTPIAPALTTADLGVVDDGALVVVGRADDVIISGGENVHPQQIEAVLAATAGVRAACAFGVADERWGQRVAAAVAVDASFALDAAIARWRRELPAFARPRELAIVDALPLSPNGKLDRRAAARLPRAPLA